MRLHGVKMEGAQMHEEMELEQLEGTGVWLINYQGGI